MSLTLPPAFKIILEKSWVFSIVSLPVTARYKVMIPVTKKIPLAIRLLNVTLYAFAPMENFKTLFLRTLTLSTFPDRKREMRNKGVTIPKTYIAPIKRAAQKLGDIKKKNEIWKKICDEENLPYYS